MSSEWTFADVWETVADTVPDAIAQVHGERRYHWRTFDRRADAVAARLLAAGLQRHDKVALYLYNTPEYLEAAFAAIHRVEGRALGTDRPDHLSRRIAGWRLDLDHVGPKVREKHRAEGPGHELRDVQDAHTLQGARPAAGNLRVM